MVNNLLLVNLIAVHLFMLMVVCLRSLPTLLKASGRQLLPRCMLGMVCVIV